jgi:hypothetical protein
MGILIKADFKKKLDIKLYRFDPKISNREYHAEIFCEMFSQFPQFKAHVAAYIERNYCFVINDEDHSDPNTLLTTLCADEIRKLNEWVSLRNKPGTVARKK